MKIEYIPGPRKLSFKVLKPLFLPFFSNNYIQEEAFDLNLSELEAGTTSGSPIITDNGNLFLGFRYELGGHFVFDGEQTLTVEIPEGQELMSMKKHPRAWLDYARIVLGKEVCKEDKQDFWQDIEYCTWMEQRRANNENPWEVLNHKFVLNYVDSLVELDLPKGKLTIDHGWCESYGEGGFGDWDVNPGKFPNFEKTIEYIKRKGFVPSLWLSPVLIAPDSKLAKRKPVVLGRKLTSYYEGKFYQAKACREMEAHYQKIFTHYIDMGIRKFKLDGMGFLKNEMKELLKLIYEVIKGIDATVEIESHIPDIHISRYCDVIRSHDIYLGNADALKLTKLHWSVCRMSSPHKLLNNDFIGGCRIDITEKDYIEQMKMFLGGGGYPMVSMLPHYFSREAVEKTRALLLAYDDLKGIVGSSVPIESGEYPPLQVSYQREGETFLDHYFNSSSAQDSILTRCLPNTTIWNKEGLGNLSQHNLFTTNAGKVEFGRKLEAVWDVTSGKKYELENGFGAQPFHAYSLG